MSRIKPAVSLYSLQDEYLNHRMDLADIMRYVKEQGAEGVEILPDQMLKGAPHISDETLNQWNSLLAETGLAPVIADVFLNTNLYKNRTLTRKECIELLAEEIRQAARLGIHLIRLVSMVPYWVIEPLLPYCEAYDVAIALEIHAGMAFDIPETKAFIEEMKRVNSRYVGLVIDTGIFCRRFPEWCGHMRRKTEPAKRSLTILTPFLKKALTCTGNSGKTDISIPGNWKKPYRPSMTECLFLFATAMRIINLKIWMNICPISSIFILNCLR